MRFNRSSARTRSHLALLSERKLVVDLRMGDRDNSVGEHFSTQVRQDLVKTGAIEASLLGTFEIGLVETAALPRESFGQSNQLADP